jgi:hypothetical protein
LKEAFAMSVTALRRPPPEVVEPVPSAGAMLEYFGPAIVTAILDRDVEVRTVASEVRYWARLACATVYQPRAGDVVLAMAGGGVWYVVGVLEGHGPTVLDAPGDLELRARHGAIRIEAADGCVVTSPTVRVEAASLDLIGDTLHEEFDTVRQRISGMLEVRAKAITTAVAETWRLTARRLLGRGEDSVTIDSPSINLG